MKIILFEDHKIDNLFPITASRPGFDILCGGVTLYQALQRQFEGVAIDFFIRDYLQGTANQKFKAANTADKKVLFINSSLVPDLEMLSELKSKVDADKDFVLTKEREIIVAYATNLEIYIKFSHEGLLDFLKNLKVSAAEFTGKVFENIWDPIVYNQEIINSNLEILGKGYSVKTDKVFVGNNVVIEEGVIFDATQGPIILADEVTVKSGAVLRGPLFVGHKSVINSFCEIKDGSCIGEVCKVGGEIEASIIRSYSNKQHFGFLGHGYVGSWVNLGAGTTNSDLKNTYNPVKMRQQETGQQFLGCVIGDHVKAAIGSLIYTGKVIGTHAMLYGTVTQDVPAFTNAGSQLKRPVEYLLDVAYEVQKSVFARRGIEQTEQDKVLLQIIFEQTMQHRKRLKIKPGKPELS